MATPSSRKKSANLTNHERELFELEFEIQKELDDLQTLNSIHYPTEASLYSDMKKSNSTKAAQRSPHSTNKKNIPQPQRQAPIISENSEFRSNTSNKSLNRSKSGRENAPPFEKDLYTKIHGEQNESGQTKKPSALIKNKRDSSPTLGTCSKKSTPSKSYAAPGKIRNSLSREAFSHKNNPDSVLRSNLNMTKNIEDELLELEALLKDETIRNNLTDVIPNSDDNLLDDLSAIDMNSLLDGTASMSGLSNLKSNRSGLSKQEEYIPSSVRYQLKGSNRHQNITTPTRDFCYEHKEASNRRLSSNLRSSPNLKPGNKSLIGQEYSVSQTTQENLGTECSVTSARNRGLTRSVSQPRVSIMDRSKTPPPQKEENYSFRPMLSKRSLKIAEKLEDPALRLTSSSINKKKQKEESIKKEQLSEYKFQPNINEHSILIEKRKSKSKSKPNNGIIEEKNDCRWNHLYSMNKVYKNDLELKRLEQEKKELQNPDLTFQPRLIKNPEFAYCGDSSYSMVERSYYWKEKVEEKLKKQKEMEVGKDLEGCTFNPHTNKKSTQNEEESREPSPFSKMGIIQYFERIDLANRKKREKEMLINKVTGNKWKKEVTIPKEFKFNNDHKQRDFTKDRPSAAKLLPQKTELFEYEFAMQSESKFPGDDNTNWPLNSVALKDGDFKQLINHLHHEIHAIEINLG